MGERRRADGYDLPDERHAPDVPAQLRALPGHERAPAGLRGPLPRARPPPAPGRRPDRAGLRLGRHPRGLRGRRPRCAVAVPDRLPGQDDRGRGVPRRHLRARRGRPRPDRAGAARHQRRLPGRPRHAARGARRVRARRRGRGGAAGVRRLPRGAARDRPRAAERRPAAGPDVPLLGAGRARAPQPVAAAGAARGRGRHRPAPDGHRRDPRPSSARCGSSRPCRPRRSPAPAGRPTRSSRRSRSDRAVESQPPVELATAVELQAAVEPVETTVAPAPGASPGFVSAVTTSHARSGLLNRRGRRRALVPRARLPAQSVEIFSEVRATSPSIHDEKPNALKRGEVVQPPAGRPPPAARRPCRGRRRRRRRTTLACAASGITRAERVGVAEVSAGQDLLPVRRRRARSPPGHRSCRSRGRPRCRGPGPRIFCSTFSIAAGSPLTVHRHRHAAAVVGHRGRLVVEVLADRERGRGAQQGLDVAGQRRARTPGRAGRAGADRRRRRSTARSGRRRRQPARLQADPDRRRGVVGQVLHDRATLVAGEPPDWDSDGSLTVASSRPLPVNRIVAAAPWKSLSTWSSPPCGGGQRSSGRPTTWPCRSSCAPLGAGAEPEPAEVALEVAELLGQVVAGRRSGVQGDDAGVADGLGPLLVRRVVGEAGVVGLGHDLVDDVLRLARTAQPSWTS